MKLLNWFAIACFAAGMLMPQTWWKLTLFGAGFMASTLSVVTE